MLEYDNSAFYYFSVSLCALYVVPVTFLSLRRIFYGVFFKDRLLDKSHVRCDRELRKLKQLQAEKTAFRNVFSLPFVFNLVVLTVVWYGLVRMAMLLKDDSEIKSFDPFAILGISAGVSEREIKRAYRKMSLLYHPDKNQGDAVAEQKFMLVAKAYEALTDEVAKANYEKFGNPDGLAIPSCVALWYSHSKKYGDSMIMYDTYGFYNFAMSQHSHPRMLPEVLAGSAEFREIPQRSSDDAELGALFKKFKQNDMMAKPKYNHPAIAKANLLLHAHFLREKLSLTLQKDLDAMLKKSIQLVDGMLEISVMKSWLQTTLNLMEMQQFLTQGLWFKDPPFLQLPHLTESEVKHIVTGKNAVRSMHQYIAMKPEERKGLSGLLEEDRAEVNKVLEMMPNMELQISIGVEDEEFIAEGDIMTVTAKLIRKNVKEERVVEQKLQLQAPPKAGTYQLDIFVKSDSYVGMDLRAVAKFNVAPASTLPVYQPHPEDLELDNEPTLFEQVMNAADSSDSEKEDEDLEQEQAETKAEENKKDK
ncbi:unnamed protein product [Peronospora belbahrii]|uniref:J domain-containing protein n=1 Tax=Peronospora belbahrii TaxID=622444 RepID=A0ABN8CS40_9STRA|nr:unnamed protein product [Peronospora belbahrii]